MDDGSFFSLNSTMAETPMDLDYMDELLLEGCWLETPAGSNFLNSNTPLSSSLFDPSFSWSNIESTNNNNELESSINPIQNYPSSPSSSSLLDNLPVPTQWLTEVPDPTRRLWIAPRSNNAGSVMDRLIRALNYIRESTRNKDALIQVWIPVNSGGKRVLTTTNQPFSLDLNIPSLASYREISMNYQFPTDGNSNQQIEGMPGRVFKDKVPEWTPDVRFFTNNEYARVNDAQRFGVRGTLAVPVFEQGSHSCLGVIEVVTTAQKADYRPELESVCKALQAVDLRTTSEVSDNANANANVNTSKVLLNTYQAALPEILRVLESACSTHGLPLAQTWVSCVQQGKGGSRHSHENYARCVSTVDSACYVADASFRPFLEACSEHHLLKGQGVAGRAFTTNQPCFSPDVTSFSKTEYPLSHHARMFGLRAAVAIRLRSMNTGSSDFVLEFFLPKNCIDPEEQKELLTSLSTIIQNVCWSLRVVTDKEIEEDEEEQEEEQLEEEELELEALPVDKFIIEENAVTNKASGGDRRKTKAEKAITLQVLQQYFSGSLKDAARKIGVCPTTLKRICRQHGITRWPSRKLKKVGHSLQKLQHVIDSVQGTSGTLQIGSFYSSFPTLASPNISRTSPFVTTTTTTNNPADEQRKQSSSGSHSSSSSQCCSTASQPKLAIEQNTTIKKETAGSSGSSLKRVRSEAGIHVSNDGDHQHHHHHHRNKFFPRSHSHKSLNEEGMQQPTVVTVVADVKDPSPPPPRIKVAYGEEKIRFRLQSHWRYKDLTREINRRFGIEDGNDGFHLKYLDDDFEWVLLTCDADLQECVDVSRSSLGDTIKLSLVRISSS
ncbi:protein NLP4-like [Impatiens glandulifera]|uniref:protein NLP4-like n=1 Tax=Impatiens glandulifera TaxID=253017 RepID=UPI001FB09889|nr:protein NLP4-like [Impatiens glandulifera]XP_047327733.1 protein NLP4-like [Impatiens glandulifera]